MYNAHSFKTRFYWEKLNGFRFSWGNEWSQCSTTNVHGNTGVAVRTHTSANTCTCTHVWVCMYAHTVEDTAASQRVDLHAKAAALYRYAVLLPLFRCFIAIVVACVAAAAAAAAVVRLLFPFFVFSTLLCCFFSVKRALFLFSIYSFTSLFFSFVPSFIWLDRFVWLKSSWVIHFHLDTIFNIQRDVPMHVMVLFSLSLSLSFIVFSFHLLYCCCCCFLLERCTLFAYNVV